LVIFYRAALIYGNIIIMIYIMYPDPRAQSPEPIAQRDKWCGVWDDNEEETLIPTSSSPSPNNLIVT
jgi:hypothetical protein